VLKKVGLHIRWNDRILDVPEQAEKLDLNSFQCFITCQTTGKIASPCQKDIVLFNKLSEKFNRRYAHCSYWVNLAKKLRSGTRMLEKEINAAEKLGFTHLILHPGSFKGSASKEEAAKLFARRLNPILKNLDSIKIVLENIAHGSENLGGEISDFKLIFEHIKYPEKIEVCLDTAHAHVYGYDLLSDEGFSNFLREVKKNIGISKIALIHLNDTFEARGSKIDKHCGLGLGELGYECLNKIIQNPLLQNIPLLLELPVLEPEEEKEILKRVRGFLNKE